MAYFIPFGNNDKETYDRGISVSELFPVNVTGIVSGNDVPDKVLRAKLKFEKSKFVDAPILVDYPLTLECKLELFEELKDGIRVIGEIVNVSCDEAYLDEKGNVDVEKLQLIAFNSIDSTYMEIGKNIGLAFREGKKIK